MRRYGLMSMVLGALVFGAFWVQPEPAFGRHAKKGRLLYLTLYVSYKHASAAPSRDIVKGIGEKSGAFEITVAEDLTPFTAENLKQYDAVMFFTQGDLPMSDEQKRAFLDFIRSGHAFVGVHSATDTFRKWPDYGEMIGGFFDLHPWHQKVKIEVTDPKSKLVKFLGKEFEINDEIYQFRDFKADTSHVLLKLDTSSVDLTNNRVHQRPYGWPQAWTRTYGKGRVFYTGLGHDDAVWQDPRYQTLLLNGIKWAMRIK